MPFRKRTTWFFIADGAKARLFESDGPHAEWKLREEWRDDDARAPSSELGRDRPVRGRTIGTGAPYAVETPSEQEKAEEAFLEARARDVNEWRKKEAFDQLVIAAPPAALGYLRKKITPDVIASLIGVFDKDLTNIADQPLHAYFLEKLEHW